MNNIMKFIISLFFTLYLLSSTANAGFHQFTMHSRANCMNNESISWEWNVPRMLGTVTQHYRNGQWIHGYSTGWQYISRSAAVHWFESKPGDGWHVTGYHWQLINRVEYLLAQTDVDDCSIYDGWWDK